jgi:hyperosmotically inducible periplasmic protein
MRGIWPRRGTWVAAAVMMTCTASISRAGDRATTAAEAQYPADDTGRNARDSDGKTLTSGDQSNSKNDVEITRQVRRAIVKDDSLSTSAHNVKIITNSGVVTLRGPVVSIEEKTMVAKKAEKINGVSKVDNQLEVAKP